MEQCVFSATSDAMETILVRVESLFTNGFTGLQFVGASAEINRDAKERVRAALENLGYRIPARKLVLNLAPADVHKEGNQFDLPIAVSLAWTISEQEPKQNPARWLFAAELGLDGKLRPVCGVVSYAITAMAAGLEGVVVARENLREIRALSRLPLTGGRVPQALGFEYLGEVLDWVFAGGGGGKTLESDAEESDVREGVAHAGPTFDDMVLDEEMRLGAEVAAAGGHSILLRGTPGSGKSMFAARLSSVLPRMRHEEHLEALRIHSALTQRLPAALLEGSPPVRAPHHQASPAAILGNAENPGELALAHGGILFLDELPEFRRDLLESLREPLETGEIRVARARKKCSWKSKILLVAACNNCPCGWYGSTQRVCHCSTTRLLAYRAKLSGPVLDRIDLHLNVAEPAIDPAALLMRLGERAPAKRESQTRVMAERVMNARSRAAFRNSRLGCEFNADIASEHLFAALGMGSAAFSSAIQKTFPAGTSNRGISRALRVARTLADLEDRAQVTQEDIEQAAAWRPEMAAKMRGETL